MDDSPRIDKVIKGKISPSALMRELEDAISNASAWAENCRLAEDTSWCIWAGQSDDGLKHAMAGDDDPPFPWENASDTRIRLVEEKVRECSRVAILSARRGNWSFQGTQGMDFQKARQMSQLLRWQEAKHIPAARRERNLWTVWAWMYGCSVMGLGWETREQLALRKVSVEVLADRFIDAFGQDSQLYLETMQESLEMPTPNGDDWLDTWLAEFFPDSTAKQRKRAMAALQQGEAADVAEVRVVADHPTWQAMIPFQHFFCPFDTEDTATARWGATRRWLSRADLEGMREEWDTKFIDELLKHGGKTSTLSIDDYSPNISAGRRRWSGRQASAFQGGLGREGLFEVLYFYHYSVDEDGMPGLYCTIMSPHVRGHDSEEPYLVAKQEIYDDGSAKLPFEQYTIWDDRRAILECEGLPHLLYTQQHERKSMRDYRIDAASISILPPVRRHARDMGTPLILGPDMPVFEQVRGSTEWMQPPSSRTDMAIDLERSVERETNRLAGCYDGEVPAPVVQINQEFLVDQFTEAYARVLRRTFQLNQAYLPEVTVMRVTSATGAPFKVSREEIQGEFDVNISFDPRELDLDFARKKFEAVVRIASELDRNAITDTNMLVRFGYNIIDPAWADALVQDEGPAGELEIRETMNAVNDIVSGQQPQMKEGINAAARLQYMSQQMQSNMLLMQIAQNQEDPRFEVLQNYLKHIDFLYQQQNVNPGIGRMGVNQNQPGAPSGSQGGY